MMEQNDFFTLGKAPDNDWSINCSYVSGHHARIRKSLKGLEIEDLGSTNHTYVNGTRVESCTLRVGDSVFLSRHWELDWGYAALKKWIDEPLKVVVQDSEQHQGVSWEYDLENTSRTVVRIGRSQGNDLLIEHPRVSREHAVLRKQDGFWVIEDLGSTNGTFVDGKRIRKATVSPERIVQIAGLPVQLFPCSAAAARRGITGGEAEICLKNLCFTVPDGKGRKTILNDITLNIQPGEFVGLIGPAGSGKTTLMLQVNGYNRPSKGEVRINGIKLHDNMQAFQGFVGYVPQDDIIHRDLTVEGSLGYSAELRLPNHSRAERMKEVDRVIRDLGLDEARKVLIGMPEKKGISGGQRKKVNLAQELITQPSVFLLDEPCSGLDPQSDYEVMALLRNLCNSGKTVLLTTHNITQRNFQLLDKVIVLAKGGHLAYYGPASEAAGYFEVQTPEKIFSVLKTRDSEYWVRKYSESSLGCRLESDTHDRNRSDLIEPKAPGRNLLSQLGTLCRRFAEIKWRNTQQRLLLLLQAPVISALFGLVFGSSKAMEMFHSATPLFLLVISSVWLGASNATREIVSEKAIFQRERKVFLGVGNYIASKLLVFAGLSAVQSLLLLAFCYRSCEIGAGFLGVYLILFLVGISSTCMGLLVSALSNTEASATSLIPIILIPQVVLGGMIIKLHDMGEEVKVIAGTMLSRWGFEAVIIMEEKAGQMPEATLTGAFGFDPGNLPVGVFMIALWAFFYLALTHVLLKGRR